MNRFSIFAFLGAVILLISFFHLYYEYTADSRSSKAQPTHSIETKKHVRIAATGDVMLHSPQIRSGHLGYGRYDFAPFFKEVKPYLTSCDLVIANLEVTLGGKAPYSGYPRFNAPDELVDAIKEAGVDVVSTANNHAMDTGELGVKRTYRVVNERGIKTVGTARSPEERKATMITKNGVNFAFLAYTESTNGLPISKTYLVNTIDPVQIEKDIKEAKTHGADFIFVSLHFGTEYMRTPNYYQTKISRQVLENGADVILGSHPHVIQPMKKLKIKGKDKFIIYSMGNFISNQTDPYTDEGIILYFDIEKDQKETTLKNVSYLPTFCHRYWSQRKLKYVVIPAEDQYPSSLPQYPGITRQKWARAYNHTHQHVSSNDTFPVFHLK